MHAGVCEKRRLYWMLGNRSLRRSHPLLTAASRLSLPPCALPLGVAAYRCGGALLDPDHRDDGSTLTLSVLLTDPGELEGGVFLTWRDGAPVYHELGRGDGVLFDSERVHNVSAVMAGVRHSLVVELWTSEDNLEDRHS